MVVVPGLIGFEVVKRLHTAQAAVQSLASGGAKVRYFGGVFRTTLRTGNGVPHVQALGSKLRSHDAITKTVRGMTVSAAEYDAWVARNGQW